MGKIVSTRNSAKQDDLSEYRKHLQNAEQKSQEDFDKTVLSLSGGALGISFIFLKDVIGPNPIVQPFLLFSAWVAWGLSTFSVLSSYYLSHLALRKAMRQVDDNTIRNQKPGGFYSVCTAALNAMGALLFVAGVFFIVFFANANLKTKENLNGINQSSTSSSTATSIASPAKKP